MVTAHNQSTDTVGGKHVSRFNKILIVFHFAQQMFRSHGTRHHPAYLKKTIQPLGTKGENPTQPNRAAQRMN